MREEWLSLLYLLILVASQSCSGFSSSLVRLLFGARLRQILSHSWLHESSTAFFLQCPKEEALCLFRTCFSFMRERKFRVTELLGCVYELRLTLFQSKDQHLGRFHHPLSLFWTTYCGVYHFYKAVADTFLGIHCRDCIVFVAHCRICRGDIL